MVGSEATVVAICRKVLNILGSHNLEARIYERTGRYVLDGELIEFGHCGSGTVLGVGAVDIHAAAIHRAACACEVDGVVDIVAVKNLLADVRTVESDYSVEMARVGIGCGDKDFADHRLAVGIIAHFRLHVELEEVARILLGEVLRLLAVLECVPAAVNARYQGRYLVLGAFAVMGSARFLGDIIFEYRAEHYCADGTLAMQHCAAIGDIFSAHLEGRCLSGD